MCVCDAWRCLHGFGNVFERVGGILKVWNPSLDLVLKTPARHLLVVEEKGQKINLFLGRRLTPTGEIHQHHPMHKTWSHTPHSRVCPLDSEHLQGDIGR